MNRERNPLRRSTRLIEGGLKRLGAGDPRLCDNLFVPSGHHYPAHTGPFLQLPTGVPMDPSTIQRQADRIAASCGLAQKTQLRTLLKILVEHYDAQATLQPSRVIRELWPNDSSRGSKDLAAAVHRLRLVLADYYAAEGASDPIVISLPRRAGEGASEGLPRHWIAAGLRCSSIPNAPCAAQIPPESKEIRTLPKEGQQPERSPFRYRLIAAAAAGVFLLVVPLAFLSTDRTASVPVAPDSRPPASPQGHIPSPAAEALYLRGNYFWNLRTAEGLNRAVDLYTQAIVKDPQYAEAYAGLAETYDLLPQFALADLGDSLRKAEAAADRAIALNPKLPDAHFARAFALFYGDWDIRGSDAEFRRALALDPNSALAHQWYASSLHDRFEGAACLKQIGEAVRLNPASAAIATDAAFFQADFGDLNSGVKSLQEIERTQPALASPPDFLRAIEFARGDFPDYIAQTRRYAEITRDPEEAILADAAARGWARGGGVGLVEASARAMKAALDRGAPRLPITFKLGEALVLLGRKQDALPYFRAALNCQDLEVMLMPDLPWSQRLSSDPRYAALFAEARSQTGGASLGKDIPLSFRLPRLDNVDGLRTNESLAFPFILPGLSRP